MAYHIIEIPLSELDSVHWECPNCKAGQDINLTADLIPGTCYICEKHLDMSSRSTLAEVYRSLAKAKESDLGLSFRSREKLLIQKI